MISDSLEVKKHRENERAKGVHTRFEAGNLESRQIPARMPARFQVRSPECDENGNKQNTSKTVSPKRSQPPYDKVRGAVTYLHQRPSKACAGVSDLREGEECDVAVVFADWDGYSTHVRLDYVTNRFKKNSRMLVSKCKSEAVKHKNRDTRTVSLKCGEKATCLSELSKT